MLGVAPNQQPEYLCRSNSNNYFALHHSIPTHCPKNNRPFSPGVCGIWIPVDEAEEIIKKVDPESKREPNLYSLFRKDLFDLFAKKANYHHQHTPKTCWISNFESGNVPSKPGAKGSATSAVAAKVPANNGQANSRPVQKKVVASAPPKATPSTPALTASSANSKSTPNLTALGNPRPNVPTSIPATTSPSVKGPLVRNAPTPTPEGCPQPKRRRATVVGQGPLKPALLALAPAPMISVIPPKVSNVIVAPPRAPILSPKPNGIKPTPVVASVATVPVKPSTMPTSVTATAVNGPASAVRNIQGTKKNASQENTPVRRATRASVVVETPKTRMAK